MRSFNLVFLATSALMLASCADVTAPVQESDTQPSLAARGGPPHPPGRPNIWTGPQPIACPDNYWPVVDALGLNQWDNWCYAAMDGVKITWDLVTSTNSS
jgi:hypothetical protein